MLLYVGEAIAALRENRQDADAHNNTTDRVVRSGEMHLTRQYRPCETDRGVKISSASRMPARAPNVSTEAQLYLGGTNLPNTWWWADHAR
jgi:hypothetical protein